MATAHNSPSSRCAVCGGSVDGGLVQCPKCGCGIFEVGKDRQRAHHCDIQATPALDSAGAGTAPRKPGRRGKSVPAHHSDMQPHPALDPAGAHPGPRKLSWWGKLVGPTTFDEFVDWADARKVRRVDVAVQRVERYVVTARLSYWFYRIDLWVLYDRDHKFPRVRRGDRKWGMRLEDSERFIAAHGPPETPCCHRLKSVTGELLPMTVEIVEWYPALIHVADVERQIMRRAVEVAARLQESGLVATINKKPLDLAKQADSLDRLERWYE